MRALEPENALAHQAQGDWLAYSTFRPRLGTCATTPKWGPDTVNRLSDGARDSLILETLRGLSYGQGLPRSDKMRTKCCAAAPKPTVDAPMGRTILMLAIRGRKRSAIAHPEGLNVFPLANECPYNSLRRRSVKVP